MNIQQIRNATIITEHGRKKILTGPVLGKKDRVQPLPSSRNQHPCNPLHELPLNDSHLSGCVIMNDEDVIKAAATTSNAKPSVTHLEGVSHSNVTCEMMKKCAEAAGILNRVFIPEDEGRVGDLQKIKE